MRVQILLIAMLLGLIIWVGLYDASRAIYWQWAHPYHDPFFPLP